MPRPRIPRLPTTAPWRRCARARPPATVEEEAVAAAVKHCGLRRCSRCCRAGRRITEKTFGGEHEEGPQGPRRDRVPACFLRNRGHAGARRPADRWCDRVAASVTIVIEGERIARIERGYVEPGENDTVIDLREHTVLPGLIDLHTHLVSEQSPQTYSEGFRRNPGDYAFDMVVYAGRTLQAGFTTVRDLGDSYNLSVSLRNAIARGSVDGPRIFTAATAIATTGGHADPTNNTAELYRFPVGPEEGVINGAADAYRAVRQRYKEGADLIKITATGGVLSVAKSGQNPQFTLEEVEAIVAAAKDYGFHVAAHAHGAEGIRRAVIGGVRSIEHGTYMDDELMRLMK